MGFNKRYFSEESIRQKAKNSIDYLDFFKYFRVDASITQDKFSVDIVERMSKLKITDEEEILIILRECK
jgi:hypothetical protein